MALTRPKTPLTGPRKASEPMARKPALTKAHETNEPKPTPTKSIGPNPNHFSNPLLTDPAIHADLKPLFDAVVMVSVWSSAIARCYPDLLALKESCGLPKSKEWPDSPALERNRAQHAEWVKALREEYAAKGESVAVADFLESRWTELMREWSGYYRDWCAAIATAKQAAKSPAVAALMDTGESRPAHRWTTQTIIDLDKLAGTLHPMNVGGVDGLGFIRCGLPPLPQDFRTQAEAVGNRIGELRSIPVSAVPPTPTVSVSPDLLDRLQRAAAAVDPGAIDRVAERAAEKIARVFGAGDNGDAKPKTLPAGADESTGPALTVNQSRVLQTMALFDASRLLSSKMIAEEMDATVRLSEETVRICVGKLIESHLAERPEGDRSGARLNSAGRKLAGKIAD